MTTTSTSDSLWNERVDKKISYLSLTFDELVEIINILCDGKLNRFNSTSYIDTVRDISTLITPNESFIAGGAVLSVIDDAPINDVDIFFKTNSAFLDFKVKMSSSKKYSLLAITDNAWTFKHDTSDIKVQLIYRNFGKVDDILDTFDFDICKISMVTLHDGDVRFIMKDSWFMDYNKRQINITNGLSNFDADLTFNRLVKYIKKGYTPSVNCKIRLMNAIALQHADGTKQITPIDISDYNNISTNFFISL